MMNKELQRNAALNQYKKTLAPEAIAHNIQMALVSI